MIQDTQFVDPLLIAIHRFKTIKLAFENPLRDEANADDDDELTASLDALAKWDVPASTLIAAKAAVTTAMDEAVTGDAAAVSNLLKVALGFFEKAEPD